MKDSTRKLVSRLKHLIKEASENSRLMKIHERTPFDQRPPLETPPPNWAQRAHILCAVRAEMRGRFHRQEWAVEGTQVAAIEAVLVHAEKWEAQTKKDDRTFPKWLRVSIRTAILAGKEERELRIKRNARFAAHEKAKSYLTENRAAS